MHFEVRKMKNHEKCLKCGSTSCEVKTIAMPKIDVAGILQGRQHIDPAMQIGRAHV